MNLPEPISPDGHMRIGDAERQLAADRLSAAIDAGHLTVYEYDARLQQLYAARTKAELVPIIADLPAPQSKSVEPASPRLRDAVPPGVVMMWIPWAAVSLLCVAIWLATGADYFWPFWVAVPWGCALLIPTGFGILTRRHEGQFGDGSD